MTNEKGFAAYSVLGNMADDLIMDALLAEDKGVAAAPVKKERFRRLSAFFESGWSVAIICALVAVSVMGGIIWAGQQPYIETPPVGMPISPGETKKETPETEQMTAPDEPSENETDVSDTQESEDNAVVLHGLERKYIPPKFLCNSTTLTEGEDGLQHGETADGLGFEGVMQSGETPFLPTVIWVKDGISDYLDVAEGYTVKEFKVYDMDMQLVESGSAVQGFDSEESVNRFIIKKLPVGKWYMSLRVEHDGGEMHHCVYEYAFVADVLHTLDSQPISSCTVKTDKDRYAWGWMDGSLTATLTSTEAGAILDIGDESWQLRNLETGEYVPVAWAVVDYGVTTNANGDRSLIIPNSSTAFAKYQNVLRFDWETTPPGRYRLTYTGVELAEGEECPYCDFEIYDPEAHPEGIYVQGGDSYVIPKEAMLWVEFWDEATGTMLSGDGAGHSHIKEYASELPVLSVREGLAMDVMNAEISYCILYDQNFEILYEGKEWINTTDYVIGPFYVVFTVCTQGEYIEEADAYEGSAYEYAFCLSVPGYCDGSCAETELPYFVETTPTE